METIFYGLAVYVVLLLIFRASGKRSLGQVTTFDFVLLLIIAETTQQALLGDDHSLANAFLLIVTLVGTDIALSFVKQRWPMIDRMLEGLPSIIVENGTPDRRMMKRARIDESDILAAARELQGVERMDQIKYAVLERNGAITIVKK
jgi:uncharacterized membrane protein YcaP (DUF421 family)